MPIIDKYLKNNVLLKHTNLNLQKLKKINKQLKTIMKREL